MRNLLRTKKCEFCGLNPCVCGDMDIEPEDKSFRFVAWVVDFMGNIIGSNPDFEYDKDGKLRYRKE